MKRVSPSKRVQPKKREQPKLRLVQTRPPPEPPPPEALPVEVPRAAPVPAEQQPQETHCRVAACEALAVADGYCRLHYIQNWQPIQRKREIIRTGKLETLMRAVLERADLQTLQFVKHDLEKAESLAAIIHELDHAGESLDTESITWDEMEDASELPSPDQSHDRDDDESA